MQNPVTSLLRPSIAALALLCLSSAHAASEAQNPHEIVQLAKQTLLAQPNPYQGQLEIAIELPDTSKYPGCDQLQPSLASGAKLRSQMSVHIRCLAPQQWRMLVRANVSLPGFHYVANRQINPGEVISLDDLHAVESDLLRLPSSVATDPSNIIGYVATQRIPVGRNIRTSALRDPQAIIRGQRVRTEVKGKGFHITGEGQALQTGMPGSHIQVKTSSGQIITGVVINATTVQVP